MEPSPEPTPWTPQQEPLGEHSGWRSPESTATFEVPREPETAPQGQRLGPPPVPPAPPGTSGSPSPFEEGPSDRWGFGPAATIQGVLSQLAPVPSINARTGEMLQIFEWTGDRPHLQGKLRELVDGLRDELALHISELHSRIDPEANRYLETDLHAWRQEILRLIIRGANRDAMDQFFQWAMSDGLKTGLFARVEADRPASGIRAPSGHFSLRTRDVMSPARAGMVPAGTAARLYLDDLLQDIRDPKNYTDRKTFEKQVGQKALALIYAAWLAHLGRQPKPAPAPPPRRAITQEEMDAVCQRLLGGE